MTFRASEALCTEKGHLNPIDYSFFSSSFLFDCFPTFVRFTMGISEIKKYRLITICQNKHHTKMPHSNHYKK
jgi:hypothetical protein